MKKSLIVLLVAIAVLAGLYVLLSSGVLEKKEPVKTEEPAPNLSLLDYITLPDLIEIDRRGDVLTFERNADKWVCSEYPDYPIDNDKLNTMGDFLSKLTAVRMLDEESPLYGLSDPSCTIGFRIGGGAEYTLVLGDKNVATGDYYAAVKNTKVLFTMAGSGTEPFYGNMIDFVLVPEIEDIEKEYVTAVTVNGSVRENAGGVVSAINSLYLSSCEEPFTESLGKYGLESPAWDIVIDYRGEAGESLSFGLKIGDPTEDGKYHFVTVSGLENTVYRCFNINIDRIISALEG